MNRLQYEMRGIAYWMECANLFRTTVTARSLPLGLRIQGYKRDAVARGLYRRGVHEPGLTKFLLDTFSDTAGCHFLDIGANIGYFSCLLGKLAGPSGSVAAVEPEPQNLRLLGQNVKANHLTNVTIHRCAVGAAASTARLGIYKAANRGRHSLVDLQSCDTFIEVPVRRLDDLLKDSRVERWSLLKIDVEGFEPSVFQGAPETLSRTETLAMEYAPLQWKSAGIEPRDVLQLLLASFSRIFRFQGLDLQSLSIEDCLQMNSVTELVLQR